jgi:hypothetical protein
MCQYSATISSKCTTLVQDFEIFLGLCGHIGHMKKISVSSGQLCYEPKTGLKLKVYIIKYRNKILLHFQFCKHMKI